MASGQRSHAGLAGDQVPSPSRDRPAVIPHSPWVFFLPSLLSAGRLLPGQDQPGSPGDVVFDGGPRDKSSQCVPLPGLLPQRRPLKKCPSRGFLCG